MVILEAKRKLPMSWKYLYFFCQMTMALIFWDRNKIQVPVPNLVKKID